MFKFISKLVLFVVCPTFIVVGSFALADYSNRPGSSGEIERDLKTIDRFSNIETGRSSGYNQPSLFVFYHPKCPCTMATFRCLERLQPTFSTKPTIIAVAYSPGNETESWINSSSTEIAQRIEGLEIIVDPDSQLARRFGVQTSGHDCRASAELTERVRTNRPNNHLTQWPVFGCPIYHLEGSIR